MYRLFDSIVDLPFAKVFDKMPLFQRLRENSYVYGKSYVNKGLDDKCFLPSVLSFEASQGPKFFLPSIVPTRGKTRASTLDDCIATVVDLVKDLTLKMDS